MFDVEQDLATVGTALAALPRARTDAERITLIRTLEDLKATIAATQAVLTADLATSQRRAQADAGMPTRRHGDGTAAQIALARRESPARAAGTSASPGS